MRSFYITSILKYKTNSWEEGGVFIILRQNYLQKQNNLHLLQMKWKLWPYQIPIKTSCHIITDKKNLQLMTNMSSQNKKNILVYLAHFG
jgi:hypothetical protein